MVVLLLGLGMMVNPESPAKTNAVEVDEDTVLSDTNLASDEVVQSNQVMGNANNASSSDEGIMTLATGANPSVGLAVSNNNREIGTVQGGSTAYSDHVLTITGEEVTNYTLSMSSTSSDLAKPSGASGANITGAGGVTGNNMPANRWGYAVTEESMTSFGGLTYNTVPTSSTQIASGNASSSNTLNAKKKIVFAARFGEDAAPGNYKHGVTLSVVANASAVAYKITYNSNGGGTAPAASIQESAENSVTFTLPGRGDMGKSGYVFLGWSTSSTATTASYAPGSSYTVNRSNPSPTLYAVWKTASFNTNITTMQQMTSSICQNADIGATKVLTDNRSGYASGTMTIPGGITHNMNQYVVIKMLDGTCWMAENLRIMNMSISSSNSDMTSGSFTIPASDKSGFTESDQYERKAYYENDTTYGAYYNWFTATAGTGASSIDGTTNKDIAPGSICPKGWKLPAYSGTGSFYNITNGADGYKDSKGSFTELNGKKGRILGYNSNDAFWPAAGYVANSSLNGAGSNGVYWSRRAHNSSYAYQLSFYSSGVYPQVYNGIVRSFGCSVRCVAQ